MDPTLTGFTTWLAQVAGVPTSVLPVDSPYPPLAYGQALNVALLLLKPIPSVLDPAQSLNPNPAPSVYAMAVYNLGMHYLVESVQDDPAAVLPTFWQDLRKKFGVGAFSPGVVQSTSDQGTATSLSVPPQLTDLTLMNLDQIKTPWGRTYVALSGQFGIPWGIS